MRAIFFDLDGTLGGHGMGNGVYLKQVWAELQERHPDFNFGEAREFLLAYRSLNNQCWGAWVKKELVLERDQVKPYIFEQLLRKFGMDAAEAQALAPELNAGLLAAFPDDWRPAPGVLDVLDWAKAQGYVLGVISNGHEAEQTGKLRDHGLLPYFDHLLFSQQLGFGKPDPRVFEHALSLVNAAPADVLVVGDSYSHDIEPAERLGMPRIWIFDDAPILGLPDDRSIAALRDLPEKLQSVLA